MNAFRKKLYFYATSGLKYKIYVQQINDPLNISTKYQVVATHDCWWYSLLFGSDDLVLAGFRYYCDEWSDARYVVRRYHAELQEKIDRRKQQRKNSRQGSIKILTGRTMGTYKVRGKNK